MDIWSWYLDGTNSAKVARLCAKLNGQDADEAYGKVIDQLLKHGQHWLDQYDSTRSSLNTYMLMRIGYALRDKGLEKKERFLTDQETESLAYTSSEPDLDSIDISHETDPLVKVLCHLSGYDQWLITARHVYKLSFSLMGERLGANKGMVREHYLRAIVRARRYT